MEEVPTACTAMIFASLREFRSLCQERVTCSSVGNFNNFFFQHKSNVKTTLKMRKVGQMDQIGSFLLLWFDEMMA